MYTLAIETANKTLSVALFKDDECVQTVTQHDTLQHSVYLVPAIEQLLKQEGIVAKQLAQIVVSNGPGSYTGLRMGVTFAKTLSETLHIPVIPVSSLDVLAHSVELNGDVIIVPFFDARRGYVYAGVYDQAKPVIADQHLLMTDLLLEVEKLNKPVVFVSPDSHIYQAVLSEKEVHTVYPIANVMLAVSKRYDTADAAVLTPFYLNKVEAEVNWEKDNQSVASEQLVERQQWQ